MNPKDTFHNLSPRKQAYALVKAGEEARAIGNASTNEKVTDLRVDFVEPGVVHIRATTVRGGENVVLCGPFALPQRDQFRWEISGSACGHQTAANWADVYQDICEKNEEVASRTVTLTAEQSALLKECLSLAEERYDFSGDEDVACDVRALRKHMGV